MKKIVLLSVGQPSTNPRLVKEANSLVKAGFDVYVVYSYWAEWAWQADKILFKEVKWKPILAGGSPFDDKITYFFSRVRVKLFGFIVRNVTLRYGIAEIAKGRTYPNLVKIAKSIKADLYIAHVQAALPAAVNAAKKYNAKCGFDAEDFHRNEVTDDVDDLDYKVSRFIDDKYLPQVNYLSTSSPFISKAYHHLYKNISPVTILNVFPVDEHVPEPQMPEGTAVRLFWFSQTVSPARGVNDCISALKMINNPGIELHLLGFADAETKRQLANSAGDNVSLVFHDPIAPGEIIPFASTFDIGLAMEDSTPYNRDICLTNKIFTYMQAGLAIIASDTTAQKGLMGEYPETGKIYENRNVQSLAQAISYYADNRNELYTAKKASYNIARSKLNWEKESEKFLALVNKTLAS